MEHTTNLNLKKPEYWELADISDINDNMDTLDAEVDRKVDKISGKGLSTNDYTPAEKSKLAGIETGANKYAHPANHPPSIITQDSNNRLVTDTEKATWNGKQNALGYTPVNKAGDTMTGDLAVTKITQRPTGVPVANLGTPSITEMALFDSQFDNKTWFYPPEMFTFEYTSDGDTWLPHNISEGTVKRLVSGNNNANFSIPRDCLQYRIRIDNRNSYVYTNALYMYMSTAGNSTKIVINKKRDDGDWVSHTNSSVNVSGWPGHVYLPYTTLAWSRASTASHFRYIEILFTPNWNHKSNNITIYGLELWGGYPAGSRSIFKWDEDQNVTFPAKLKSVQTNALDTDNTLVTKKYIDDKVKTDVPVGAKFTDTITTINGKTGEIAKADIVALGIPAQDTVYTHPGSGTNPHGTTKADVGLTNVTNDKQATKTEFDDHNIDTTKHITAAERTAWNAKSTLLLGESTSTAYRGDRGKIAYEHSQSTHAPSDAQKNSDIAKAEIEAKLTGTITTHTHTFTKADVELANVDNVKQMPLSGGTATGAIVAQNNTAYTTSQVRNMRLIAEGQSVPSLGDGEIALVYSTAVMP